MANPQIIVEFLAKTAGLVAAVKDVGKATEETGKATKKIDFKKIAGFAAGASAMAAGAVYIKKASDATVELAKSSQKLARTTGMDVEAASAWVSTLETRGIAIDQFQQSVVKLSKAMEKAREANIAYKNALADYAEVEKNLQPIIDAGGKAGKDATKELNKWGASVDKAWTAASKAEKPFRDMGVALADVRAGNTESVILQLADGFAKITNPAEKAATAQALFGRAGQKLLPLLEKGSAGIEKQLGLAEKYGAVIGKKQVDQINKNIQAQRELKLAQKGLQVQIASALLPAQVLLYGALLDVTNAILPLLKEMGLLTPLVIAGGVVWVAYKVAAIAAMIAQLGLNASMLPTIGIVAGVVLGLAALAAGFVIAYKKVDWFRDVVDATFSWIKKNWPLLLAILTGPIGTAVILIVKNWDKIADGAETVIATVKAAFTGLKNFVVGVLNMGAAVWEAIKSVGEWIGERVATITAWGSKIGGAIKQGVVDALTGLANALQSILEGALNAVIRAWNRLELPGFTINPPGPGKLKIPGVDFPNIRPLAAGGIVTGPTLAMIGEAGPEAVIPLGAGAAGAPIEVHVFIGDTELRGLVRTEVVDVNTGIARTLLAGAR